VLVLEDRPGYEAIGVVYNMGPCSAIVSVARGGMVDGYLAACRCEPLSGSGAEKAEGDHVGEIVAEAYNCNIYRYVDNAPSPEPHDVRVHLYGGVALHHC